MSLLPREVSLEHARHELPGAMAWAVRRGGWTLTFDEERLVLCCSVAHPSDGEPLYLVAELTDYKVLPPIWRFTTENGASNGPGIWPKGAPIGPGKGSIFHNSRLICAPFSRKAFKELGGPHANWGGPTNWLDVPDKHVRAVTLGDMLSVIDVHLSTSPGRM